MKLNFDIELKNLSGEPVIENDKPVILRNLVTNAVLVPEEGEEGEIKLTKWNLALKIDKGGEIDLTPEEVVLIKRMVGKYHIPMVVGRIYPLLNG